MELISALFSPRPESMKPINLIERNWRRKAGRNEMEQQQQPQQAKANQSFLFFCEEKKVDCWLWLVWLCCGLMAGAAAPRRNSIDFINWRGAQLSSFQPEPALIQSNKIILFVDWVALAGMKDWVGLFDWIPGCSSLRVCLLFAEHWRCSAHNRASNKPSEENSPSSHQTPMEQQLHQSSIIDDWRAGLFPWGPAAPRREIKINLFFPLGREEKLIVWFHFSRGHSSNIFII